MVILNSELIIENVIKNFNNIKITCIDVGVLFQEIKQKLVMLNTIYTDIVKTHSIKEYTFGLDAFHFQNKLIECEYDHMQHLMHTITNRFYCEYYKLYKIIREYIDNELKISIKVAGDRAFPVYKDLDKNVTYELSLTIDIQAIILKYINALNDYSETKHKELNNNTQRSKCGINIEHIVHYQTFTYALLEEQIMMYIHYMEALNKHHTKYITRLYTIVKDFIDDINEDIVSKDNGVDADSNYESTTTKSIEPTTIIEKTNIMEIKEEHSHTEENVIMEYSSLEKLDNIV